MTQTSENLSLIITFFSLPLPLSSLSLNLSMYRCSYMNNNKTNTTNLKNQEDANRGKPNWEHLSDELHVLITVEDTENRAQMKLERAVEEVKKLLVPVSTILTI